ncbi:MAG: mechanosensitive ion channel family protein [bacterium]
MPESRELSDVISSAFQNAVEQVIAHMPNVLAALALFLVGCLVAWLLRITTQKLLTALNALLERVLSGRARAVIRFSSGIKRLIAAVVFWAVLFAFVTAALHTAGLESIATWMGELVVFLPSILTGGLIILLGYILGVLVRDVTYVTSRSIDIREADLISRLAQTITLLTAIVIGLDQMGVDVTFLTMIIGVSFAALLAGFSLAFGLGAKTLVSNLIATHYFRQTAKPGQKIRIGDKEGIILEFTPTTVIINTAEGRESLPAKLFHEQSMLVLIEDSQDD